MNKSVLSKQIKLEILAICDGPVAVPEKLTEGTELGLLGYDEYEAWCRQLENRLQHIAIEYHTGKEIPSGNITPLTTVDQCIQMVM